jgi:hypothetical protein
VQKVGIALAAAKAQPDLTDERADGRSANGGLGAPKPSMRNIVLGELLHVVFQWLSG